MFLPTSEDLDSRTMAKKLRCYLGFHRWQQLQAEGGGSYKKCRDCGRFSDLPQRPFLPGGN
jgi:hypothetical protein